MRGFRALGSNLGLTSLMLMLRSTSTADVDAKCPNQCIPFFVEVGNIAIVDFLPHCRGFASNVRLPRRPRARCCKCRRDRLNCLDSACKASTRSNTCTVLFDCRMFRCPKFVCGFASSVACVRRHHSKCARCEGCFKEE